MDDLKTAGEKFDIVFLDAPKDQYIPTTNSLLTCLHPLASSWRTTLGARCFTMKMIPEDSPYMTSTGWSRKRNE